MHRLDFKEASETVKAVDEELEALLRVVWGQAARERQRDLCFYLAKYPYKHFVLKNGRPAGDDPWEADTLEWATTSPPQPYNFARIPVVHSARPLKEDVPH